jgi:hypothetical protein
MQQICGIRSCGAPLAVGVISRGLRLCSSCRSLLADRLASLPRLYQACEQALEVRRQNTVRVIRGRRPTGICLDDLTMAVRGNTIRVLASWCEMIVDERGVTGPGSLDVGVLTSFLQAHADWLAAHAVIADFAAEIASLVADARRALDPVRTRTIDLGPCTRDGCTGMVRASVGAASQGSVPQVRCDAGHTWPPQRWLDLRRELRHTIWPVGMPGR